MTQAQRKAFIETCNSGERLTNRHIVWKTINEGWWVTLDEIAYRLPWLKPSTIAGRLSELLDAGLVVERQGNGSQSQFDTVTNMAEAERLRQMRENARYVKWVRLGTQQKYFDRYTKDFWQ